MIDDIQGMNDNKDDVTKNIEPFVAQSHYKKDFTRWLDANFKYFQGNRVAAALDEIKQNADKIYDGVTYLKTITETKSTSVLKNYYAQDWIDILLAYQKQDTERFAKAVDSLKFGIEWE
jgi:hypothetical protein